MFEDLHLLKGTAFDLLCCTGMLDEGFCFKRFKSAQKKRKQKSTYVTMSSSPILRCALFLNPLLGRQEFRAMLVLPLLLEVVIAATASVRVYERMKGGRDC